MEKSDSEDNLRRDGNWSVSGLCLMVRQEHLIDVESALAELPWLEVHARDEATGRLVVVQEHASVTDHEDGLRQLQAMEHILTADLVVHYQEPEDSPSSVEDAREPEDTDA